MIVFLDWQHAGKPGSRINDRGATGDLNQDGKPQINELEAYWTGKLMFDIFFSLYQLKIPTIVLSDGWYRDRAARAETYCNGEKSVYIALHYNALRGGLSDNSGTYGTVFYDFRSGTNNGPKLAALIAGNLENHLPELSRARALAARPDDWTRRAYSTISHVRTPVGICLESAFIDALQHKNLFTPDGITRTSRAVVKGLKQFNNQ